MSGVVYALFGYLWLYGRNDPRSLAIDPRTVRFMLAWLGIAMVLSMANLLNVANGAHAGGLAVGAGWGWLAATLRRRRA